VRWKEENLSISINITHSTKGVYNFRKNKRSGIGMWA
jgi:hypothetical protein